MKIVKIIEQYRRDFTALMKCEFCQDEWRNGGGYDDRYYHDEVVPNMVCTCCGKSTKSENAPIQSFETKYPENLSV